MCTLTWQLKPGGYELHFNRDESRLRAQAEIPTIDTTQPLKTISPRDPQAGGTWVSVNQAGLGICLLNNYIEISGNKGTTSRGLLVNALAQAEDLYRARQIFRTFEPLEYNPFNLFIFFPDQAPVRYSWDGALLRELTPNEGFISSSGFDAEYVISGRRDQFLNTGNTDLRDFHRSHRPERSAYSVCMHRPDARTQSYSKIHVDQNACSFWYSDGPPCSAELMGPLRIERRQI